jgi:hypothetical protein
MYFVFGLPQSWSKSLVGALYGFARLPIDKYTRNSPY